MKVSAATRPTKNAAISSIAAMKWSILLRGTHSAPTLLRASSFMESASAIQSPGYADGGEVRRRQTFCLPS